MKLKWTHNSKITIKIKRSCLKQDTETFNHRRKVKLFIVYELEQWLKLLPISKNFTLGDCLFVVVKFTENTNFSKYGYCGYGMWFNACSYFLINGEFG